MPVVEFSATVPHPPDVVTAWYDRPASWIRLSPPGLVTVVAGPADGPAPGSRIRLRLSALLLAGVLPGLPTGQPGHASAPPGMDWQLVRTERSVAGPLTRTVDEQVTGPLASWRHEREITAAPAGPATAVRATTVVDRITFALPRALRSAELAVTRTVRRVQRFRAAQVRDDLDLYARLGGLATAGPARDPLRVVVSGASGLIGSQVCALLAAGGHHVTRLVRREAAGPDEITWDPAHGDLDAGALAEADAVINFSGRTIGTRFTRAAKQEILASRVDSSTTLARAIATAAGSGDGASGGPAVLVQSSAVGAYGPRRPGEVLTEDSAPGGGFLAEVVRRWERAAEPAEQAGVRTVLVRTGTVLSAAGGALAPQLPLFWAGVGGRLGAPDAMVSWIGLDDIARMYVHAVLDPDLAGPVNAVAPHPVSQAAFARTVGNVLHRPAGVPTPAFGPALLLGREGADELVRTDQEVSCRKAERSGFRFGQPDLASALHHVLVR